jgi:hypothetical protein
MFAVGASAPARAASVTLPFAGTLDFVDPTLAGVFSVGQILTGTYTFESTTPARAGSDSTTSVFDALTNLNFTLGSYSASSSGAPEIQIDNDPTAPFFDRYAIVSRASDGLTGPPAAGQPLSTFVFRLDDSTNTVFTDALILPTSLNLSRFDSRQFFLFFGSPASPVIISGAITSLATDVPEPSSLMPAGIGLLGLLGFGRRRRGGRQIEPRP